MNEIIKKGYDQIAETYHSKRLAKKEVNYQYFDTLSSYFPKSGKCLDLGCGGGQPVTAYFADKGFDVVGVDISPGMIEIAKQQIPAGRFFVSDMAECTFDASEFDMIVSAFAIIHVPQEKQKALFEKIFHWLKPGGVTYFTLGHKEEKEVLKEDWNGVKMYWSYFSPEQYRALLKEIGFRLLWDETENLANGECFYNVILKK